MIESYGFYLSIGKQGYGKTLFTTKLLYDNISDNRKIYSNYTLHNLEYQKIFVGSQENKKVNELKEQGVLIFIEKLLEDNNYFNNSIILFDELPNYLNSLDFYKKNNRILHSFFAQLRKRKILLLGTAQYLLDIDIRIRRQCLNVFALSKAKKKKDFFNIEMFEIDGYYQEYISKMCINLSDYYNKYDTDEIIL